MGPAIRRRNADERPATAGPLPSALRGMLIDEFANGPTRGVDGRREQRGATLRRRMEGIPITPVGLMVLERPPDRDPARCEQVRIRPLLRGGPGGNQVSTNRSRGGRAS